MIQTGFESRIKVQDLIDHQLPEFILEESPNAVKFFKAILYFSRISRWTY